MSLEMLTLEYEKGQENTFSGTLKALFNPTQLSYTRNATWSPLYTAALPKSEQRLGFTLKYSSVSPETLNVELFFDTYATSAPAGGGLLGLLPSTGASARSVFPVTAELAALANVDPVLKRPPVCKLRWGKEQLFQGVLQQATRTLHLFLEDGTPVRATVGCVFMEYTRAPSTVEPSSLAALDRAQRETSADTLRGATAALVGGAAARYIVRPGDTLMGIASRVYGDASHWRRIAEANRIEDPRRLVPGRTLSIPNIR